MIVTYCVTIGSPEVVGFRRLHGVRHRQHVEALREHVERAILALQRAVDDDERLAAPEGALPPGDQCWFPANATISLTGRASEGVRDDTTGSCRLKNDDGSTVERLAGAANGDSGTAGVDGLASADPEP